MIRFDDPQHFLKSTNDFSAFPISTFIFVQKFCRITNAQLTNKYAFIIHNFIELMTCLGRQSKANFAAKPFCGKSAYANNEEQMQASDAMLRKYVYTHAPLVTSLARVIMVYSSRLTKWKSTPHRCPSATREKPYTAFLNVCS